MNLKLCSVLLFATTIACQGEAKEPAPQKQDPAQLLKQMQAAFQQQKITIDAKQRTVSVPVVVNHLQDPIEYLLIHKKGKKHEAIFVTDAKPSVLNAALLMVGLEKGKNATYVEKDPPPTFEEVKAGVDPLIVTPPKGKPFWMTVEWTTPEGEKEVHCVEDMVLDLTTQEPLGTCEWVYLGGRMVQIYKNDPEVYIADFEGNLISICYLTPDNHLGTAVHERARDDQNWWTTNKLPEPGTEMTFVFHSKEPKVHVDRRKRLAAKKGDETPAAKKKDSGQ